MRISKLWLGIFVVFCSLAGLFPQTAHAYLDPGSGSYFLQMLLASLLTGLYLIKLFWGKIKHFFSTRFGRGKDE
jgi:hypothetical protein